MSSSSIANEMGSETIDGYRGLGSRAPLVAIAMVDLPSHP